jgi:hypothetical protein
MSKTRFSILASAAQTASAQGGAVSVSGIKNLWCAVDVTAVSGSLTAVYLQGSSDGGTSWFDLIAEQYGFTTASGTGGTSGTYNRNIIYNLTTGTVLKAAAVYRALPDNIRAAFVIAGSGPSCTFSVLGVGEN